MEYQNMCPTSSLVPELPALPPSGPSSPGRIKESTSLTLVVEWKCAVPPHWCRNCQLCRLQGHQVQVWKGILLVVTLVVERSMLSFSSLELDKRQLWPYTGVVDLDWFFRIRVQTRDINFTFVFLPCKCARLLMTSYKLLGKYFFD